MKKTQERVLLSLITLLKAHDVDAITTDEVIELWTSSNHGVRWTIPRPKKNVAWKQIYRRKR